MINGKTNIKSINISYSKLSYNNFYTVYFSSNSSVTFSTFSNSTSTSTNSEASHQGSSNSLEFKILFCNYFENECYRLIWSGKNLYIINCSFYKNNIKTHYFYADSNRIEVKGCYLDITDPGKIGSVTIEERVDSKYPENHHLSTGLCFAELELEFPEENIIKTKTKETEAKEEIKVNNKRNNKFNFLIFLVSLVSK